METLRLSSGAMEAHFGGSDWDPEGLHGAKEEYHGALEAHSGGTEIQTVALEAHPVEMKT
jgi:hypothetical protein